MLTIDLKGRTALVTGVSKGIGQGVAKMLAKAGCNISGCSNSPEFSEGVKAFMDSVASEGRQAIYTPLNITSCADQEALIKKTVATFGGIDILVSNAGVNVFEGAENCSDKEWEFNMDLNLKSHWQLSKLCKPFLELEGKGVIIIMTSNHSNYTIPGCFPYNVAKTAIKGLVQSLAIEWGPKIRTIGIAPGFIDTKGNQKWFDSFSNAEEERQRTINTHPVKRIGTTDEVGGLCAFLASDQAAFISGTTYLMDGGRSALMQG
ncbi:SDR family oxidoreductase [Cellulophaga sp. F20128]|uniref:SDR family NAD(P)-dependent oxidoreductase n=1 Tax=Cellulophaga sp. F20128 TaxID=2926413 RepID=UPI001FF44730|nr:SDR family oxidoreductase [Cellulophaga sp. F20128]MCK0158256.1 SDR family oxidoreductase [Cellulophaga sp. F20128]